MSRRASMGSCLGAAALPRSAGAGSRAAPTVAGALCAPSGRRAERPGYRRGVGGLLALCLLPLLLTSCRTTAPVADGDERLAVARYDASLPVRFTARQTLLFEFRPHWWWPPVRLVALGYATVDRAARDYGVVCLSPLGVKLFEVSCVAGQGRASVALPLPGKDRLIGKAIGNDIANLYFDLLPAPDAGMRRRGDTLLFLQERDGRRVEHEFSISKGRLLSKTVLDDSGCTTITVGDGRRTGGYPAVVKLRNHRYGYTITVQTRQLEVAAGPKP